MLPFNARRRSSLVPAAEPGLNNGPSNQARLGAQPVDVSPGQINFRKTWHFVSVRRAGGVPTLRNLLSAVQLYANKTNSEAPCCFRRTDISVRTTFLNNPLRGLCF